MDFFRDPIWQFVGAVLALIALIISIYFGASQLRKKSLVYEVLAEAALLTLNEEIKSKIQVLYQGTSIKDIFLIVLKVWNNGYIPIRALDFERPISFAFGDNAEILSAEIIETSPNNFKPSLANDQKTVTLTPSLFNPKDTVVVKLLITQYDGAIAPDTRIVGVRELKRVTEYSLSADLVSTRRFWPTIPLTVLWMILFSLATSPSIPSRWSEILILSSFFSMGVTITYTVTSLVQALSARRQTGFAKIGK